MEIRLAKQPKPTRVWKKTRKCKKCSSELIVEEKDIQMSGVGGYTAFAEQKVPTFDCPVCGERNRLPDRLVPEKHRTLYGDGFSPATSRTPVS